MFYQAPSMCWIQCCAANAIAMRCLPVEIFGCCAPNGYWLLWPCRACRRERRLFGRGARVPYTGAKVQGACAPGYSGGAAGLYAPRAGSRLVWLNSGGEPHGGAFYTQSCPLRYFYWMGFERMAHKNWYISTLMVFPLLSGTPKTEGKSGWLPALTKRWLFIHRPAQRVGVHHESHAKCYLVRRLERKRPIIFISIMT